MTDRFTAKQLERRRRTQKRIGVVALLVALIVFGVWAAYFSSWFTSDETEVRGIEVLSAEQVEQAAAVPQGEPLLRVDTRAIARNVAALPVVEEVTVRRAWPDRIDISVTERSGAAWLRKNKQNWLVDRHGAVFLRVKDKPKLPELTVDRTDAETLAAAASVAADLRAHGRSLFDSTVRIDADSKDSVELRLDDKRIIVWGGAGETEEKLRVLRSLLDIEAERYDVSAPDNPTTKTKI